MVKPKMFAEAGVRMRALLIACLLRGGALEMAEAQPDSRLLTTTGQIKALPVEEAKRQLPARFIGTVTYCDRDARQLFVQDASGGIFIHPGDQRPSCRPGDQVEVEGVTDSGEHRAILIGSSVRFLRQGSLPSSRLYRYSELLAEEAESRLVDVSGVVQVAAEQGRGLALTVETDGHLLQAYVRRPYALEPMPILKARVRVRGVCATAATEGQTSKGVQLYVSNIRDIEIEQPAVTGLFAQDVRQIGEVAGSVPGGDSPARVRVQGVVTNLVPGRSIMIRDDTGSIEVETKQTSLVNIGTVMDVVGTLRGEASRRFLRDAEFKRIGFVEVAGQRAGNQGQVGREVRSEIAAGNSSALRTVYRIRRLTAAEAATAQPVRFRSVVTYYDPPHVLFVHGGREGVFVKTGGQVLDVKAGQITELEGVTGQGDFAPWIEQPRFGILGNGAFPEAKPPSAEDFRSGAKHGDWIELRGVVQSIANQQDRAVLEVATADGRFEATIPGLLDSSAPVRWVDAQVRIHGVCNMLFDSRRQITGMRVLVPGPEHILEEKKAPADPFPIPAQSIASLKQFDPNNALLHRVKVNGTLTHQQSDETFFIQDETGGLFIDPEEKIRRNPGQRVEVVGFADLIGNSRRLRNALVRAVGFGAPPVPRLAGADEFARGVVDGEVISLRARVVEQLHDDGAQILTLRVGSQLFDAILEKRLGMIGQVMPGSLGELTGVCAAQVRGIGLSRKHMLLMRSPLDLKILERPLWWTTRRVMTLVSLMAAVSLAGLLWVQTLRRRVSEQTAIIRQQFDRENSLQQKLQETQKLESLGVMAGGIAHDFNNLLTTILGNVSLAESEVRHDSPLRAYFQSIEKASLQAAGLCKQMLAYAGGGQVAARLLDLSSLVAETRDLLEVSIGGKQKLRFDLAKDLPAVSADEAQIRQVLLNLVINASEAIGDQLGIIGISTGTTRVKQDDLLECHGTTELTPGEYVRLDVADTGCGMSPEIQARIFDPFFTTKFTGRGLGLAAVLGIVRGHEGALRVRSQPGRGTTFRLLLPPAPAGAAQPHRLINGPPSWKSKGTILLIDDEEPVRKAVGRMLESFGFEVLSAEGGRCGINLFREQASRVDLVLLDLTMPDLNGLEVFRELKQIQPEARILVMSGYSEQETVAKFEGNGLAGFLSKPFKTEELSRMLQSVLGER
ncbi:MAG: response regulator [Verrucomicrobia bacterium]|nr:response regulator [Verrucomicrobiota bacterium]